MKNVIEALEVVATIMLIIVVLIPDAAFAGSHQVIAPKVLEKIKKSSVVLGIFDGEVYTGRGSGTIFPPTKKGGPDGSILTNEHVVEEKERLLVFTPNYSYDGERTTSDIERMFKKSRFLLSETDYPRSHQTFIGESHDCKTTLSWLKFKDEKEITYGLALNSAAEKAEAESPDYEAREEDYIGVPKRGKDYIGWITVGRVIAKHNEHDLALIQACLPDGHAIEEIAYCDELPEGSRLIGYGSSEKRGVATGTSYILIECRKGEVRYEGIDEEGRSGSPVITTDGKLLAIHAGNFTKDPQRLYGVLAQEAEPWVRSMKVARLVRLYNYTPVEMEFEYRCTSKGQRRWKEKPSIEARAYTSLRCDFDPAKLPRRMDIRYPWVAINPHRDCDPIYRIGRDEVCYPDYKAKGDEIGGYERYFIPPKQGGTVIDPKSPLDYEKCCFYKPEHQGAVRVTCGGICNRSPQP